VLFGWWRACAPPRGRLLRLQAACRGRLADVQLRWSDQAALTVVMAARGYPGSYAKGGAIAGLDSIGTAKVPWICHLILQGSCIHVKAGKRLKWVCRGPRQQLYLGGWQDPGSCRVKAQHAAMLKAACVHILHAGDCATRQSSKSRAVSPGRDLQSPWTAA
jgi:hypothetical protein